MISSSSITMGLFRALFFIQSSPIQSIPRNGNKKESSSMARKRYRSPSLTRRRRKWFLLLGIVIVAVVIFLLTRLSLGEKWFSNFHPLKSISDAWDKLTIKDEASDIEVTPILQATPLPSIAADPTIEANKVEPAKEQIIIQDDLKIQYLLDIALVEPKGSVTLTQQIQLTNTSDQPMNELALYYPLKELKSYAISQVVVNGQHVDSQEKDGDDKLIYYALQTPLQSGEQAKISLQIDFKLNQTNALPGENGRSFQAARFYAQVPVYQNHTWQLSSKEHAMPNADYLISLSVPDKSFEGYDLSYSGQLVQTTPDYVHPKTEIKTTLYQIKAQNKTEFAFVYGSSMREKTITAGQMQAKISSYHTAATNKISSTLQSELQRYQVLFGDYDQTITVFESSIDKKVSYGGDIMVVDSALMEREEKTVASYFSDRLARLYLAPIRIKYPKLYEALFQYATQRIQLEDENAQPEVSATAETEDSAEVTPTPTPILPAEKLGARALLLIREESNTQAFDGAIRSFIQAKGEKPLDQYFTDPVLKEQIQEFLTLYT